MKVSDLEKFYGTQAAAADAIDVSRQSVSLWGKQGGIPIEWQIKWEVQSKGGVKADLPPQLRKRVA